LNQRDTAAGYEHLTNIITIPQQTIASTEDSAKGFTACIELLGIPEILQHTFKMPKQVLLTGGLFLTPRFKLKSTGVNSDTDVKCDIFL